MASGFGYSGGRSRCHWAWIEFAKCYAGAEDPQQCVPQKADYLECLHHTKEIKRAQTIKTHYEHAEHKRQAQKKEEAAEQPPVPKGILGIDLAGYDIEKSPGQGVKQPNADSKAAEKAPQEAVKQSS